MSRFSPSALWARGQAALRSNTFVYLAASVVGRIGSIVLLPLYTRKLTAESYGTYGLALTLMNLLPLCISGGLTAGLTKEFYDAKTPEEGRTRLGSVAKGMLLVSTTFAIVLAGVALIFLRNGIGPLNLRQLLWIDAAAVGTCGSYIPDAYLRSAQRPKPVVALQLGTLLGSSGFGVLFVSVLGQGVDGAIHAATCTALLTGLIGVLFTFLYLGGTNVVATTRRLLPFSTAFIPHFIASWAQDVGDRWLLSSYGGGSALGPYYVASQLLSPVPMVVTSLNSAETPRIGELYRKSGFEAVRRDLRRQYALYFVAGFLPALAIVVASPIVSPIIGSKLRGAIALMPFLAIAYVIDALYQPGTNAIFYSGRSRAIPITTALSAGTGLMVAYLLLRAYGLPGLIGARIITASIRSTLIGSAARFVTPKATSAPSEPVAASSE